MFNRMTVFFSEKCLDSVQYRFPKSNKKRIKKKWAKKPSCCKDIPSKNLKISHIMMDGSILGWGHPSLKSHLEYLNSCRVNDEDPLFTFGEEK